LGMGVEVFDVVFVGFAVLAFHRNSLDKPWRELSFFFAKAASSGASQSRHHRF
jgi:hypothetical protein